MRIPDPPADLIQRAANGDLAAMDALLRAIERGIFNLAVRMLGHREDAADASQEILLKVTTHLGGYRGEAAFSTWVYRIARNHLTNAATRVPEAPTVSLEQFGEKLDRGLAHGRSVAAIEPDAGMLPPEDRAEAVDIAVGCTQGMLMALDRDHRLAYLFDVVFGLTSEQGGDVLEISAAAFRKRLSRARERLDGFMQRTCGLVNADAPCRCPRQLPAVRAAAAADGGTGLRPTASEVATAGLARIEFDRWRTYADAAAVFRGHPDYRPPERMVGAIRELLRHGGDLPPSTH